MKVIALNNQTLLDIAIQEYGTVEAIFDLALANGLSITDELAAGKSLLIPKISLITGKPVIINTEVLNYYKKYNIKPATATPMVALLNYGDINMISNYFE